MESLSITEVLPQDVFRRILSVLPSYDRAVASRVCWLWNAEAVAVSKLLCICPRVFNPDHKITINQCKLIVEDGDYHTSARNQTSITALATSSFYEGSAMISLACRHGHADMIVGLFQLGCNMYVNDFITLTEHGRTDLFQQIISLYANRPSDSKMHIEYNIRSTPKMLKIACKYGLTASAEIIIDVMRKTYCHKPWKNKCLTIACENNHVDICQLLLDVGAHECKNEKCHGHQYIALDIELSESEWVSGGFSSDDM